jgi:hypothetical protein
MDAPREERQLRKLLSERFRFHLSISLLAIPVNREPV